MIKLRGKYNDCKIFTDLVDQGTVSQLIELLNQPYSKLYGAENLKDKTQTLIKELKTQDRKQKIQAEIARLKTERKQYAPKIPKNLTYLENDDFWDYIHDVSHPMTKVRSLPQPCGYAV